MAKNRERKDKDEVQEMYDMDIPRVDAVTEPASKMKFLIIKSLDGREGQSLEDLLNEAKGNVSKADDGDGKSERDKLREEAEKRAKKYGISFKEGKGHLTPPKGKPTDPEQYGDPVNYAYPIDEKHIRAAVSYFNHEGQREAGGYTTEEWAIIGKRIAEAANKYLGDGYKYENGKIVTPNNSDDGKSETKKGDDDMADELKDALNGANDAANTEPGSPEWEKVDAQMMEQAVSGLLALKELICRIAQREKAEVIAGDDGDQDQVFSLMNAIDAITYAIKEVAGVAALEAHEAQNGDDGDDGDENDVENSVTKAGRKMSKDSMAKVHQAMTHIVNAAGFKTVKEFDEAAKAMGIVKDDDSDNDAEKAKGHMSEDDDTQKAKNCKSSDGSDENADDMKKDKQPAKKSAVGESPAADAVVKALEATGLTTLAKSAGDLLEAAKVIKSLEERVQALENQPMPGGPMLRGAATRQDYYLVRKGESPDLNEPNVLNQALQYVQDPYIRDVLSREAARRMHPAHQNK